MKKINYKHIIVLICFGLLLYIVFTEFRKTTELFNELENPVIIGADLEFDTTFVPVPNDGLTLNASMDLPEETLESIDARISDNEKKVEAFDASTQSVDKMNTYFLLSVDYQAKGEYAKAKEMIEQGLYLYPQNSNLMHIYSTLLAEMGDQASALLFINKALSLYGSDSNYWLWKIELEKGRGLEDKRLEDVYKNALDVTKEDLNILRAYAEYLEVNNKKSEAINVLKRAIELYPEEAEVINREIDRLEVA